MGFYEYYEKEGAVISQLSRLQAKEIPCSSLCAVIQPEESARSEFLDSL